MRIHFVSAPGGSAFMHELLTVVAHEVESCVTDESDLRAVTVSEGAFPEGDSEDVYVVVPHEYFVVIPPDQRPTDEQLQRTIGFCVEHPGNETFETTVRFASQLAACVDINGDSTGELNRRGIPTERFVLGYSELWDAWHGSDDDRGLDMVYLGTTDPRRSQLLVQDFRVLDEYELFLAIPPHEPMTRPRPDFFMGEAKHRLLANSKTLLNLHRGASRSLEWFRYLEAACNGCVVVSEHSPDFAPLIPGEHILFGSPRSLPYLTRDLLADEQRLEDMRTHTYSFLREELTMKSSALLLCEVAASVSEGAARPTSHALASTFVGALTSADPVGDVVREASDGEAVSEASGANTVSLDRHRLGQLAQPGQSSPPTLEVVVVCRPGALDPAATVESLAPLVDPDSARLWVLIQGAVPMSVCERDNVIPISDNADALIALNTLAMASPAKHVLILESDDRLARDAHARLAESLDESDADAAYGMVATADGAISSALPFEPERVQRLDYLELASLWRSESLIDVTGSEMLLTDESNLATELWRRLAVREGTAHLVPRILVSRG